PLPQELNALRWLAQLAVNIVDFIDKDDYLTPFCWGKVGKPRFYSDLFASQPDRAWVFGNELPRLVLNEAYAERTRVGNVQEFRFWVELLNPLHSGGGLTEGGRARLQVTAGAPVHRLLIAVNPPDRPAENADALRLPDNVRGELLGAAENNIRLEVRNFSG